MGFMCLQATAIQGERGSNSHLAALRLLGPQVEVVPYSRSAEVVDAVVAGEVPCAVLPIENSLHGSVAEHYDLLLEHPLRIDAEVLLRVEHHLIAMPGVQLAEIRRILSHPVALSQCRRFLAGFRQGEAEPFYDTAGSVRHVIEAGLRDTAGMAPRLAAEIYGGEVVAAHVEDHAENFTRFHLLHRADARPNAPRAANKLSFAFAVDHHPGTLVRALEKLAAAGANLTKIESRPVPGKPWEYVFFVDTRFEQAGADAMLEAIRPLCIFVKELGRYAAA